MPKLKVDDLIKQYREADEADQEIFAEQRSNILLIAGDHYNKKGSKYWNRIRDTNGLSQEQKLRLTKNHIQKIVKHYVNNLTSYAPGVTILPTNENELQDQKSAELHLAVWNAAKDKHKLKQFFRQCVQDFVYFGEVATKIYWDPNGGELVGMEAEMGEDGTPVVDEQGQMKPSERGVFKGDFKFERLYPFNLLRSPDAKTFEESPFLTYRKMVDIKALKAMVGGDEEKTKMLDQSSDETVTVFDGSTGQYKKSEEQTMLLETFYRPSPEYPKGYYYIYTFSGILFEGELPFGLFPIVTAVFDEVPTSARGRAIVKQLRPYQAEINRTASKIAEHQITLGDDKLLIQSGTKLAQGGILPGVRGVTYTGMAPTVIEGRTGVQYLEYMQSQISEMYAVANMDEDSQEKDANVDPYTLLFRSLRDKKRFSLYSDKIEQFFTDFVTLYLENARNYLPEDEIIYMVGRREQVNISEFKNETKLCYQIKLEPSTEDINSTMGKQLTMNHFLQYAGQNMSPETVGKLLKNMPFANIDESFNDLTMDYENATNDILGLDRGEQPAPNKRDNHAYLINRLINRMKQADFKFLPPQVQQNYEQFLQFHEQMLQEEEQAAIAAKSEYIPSGGYLVTVDFYVQDPVSPEKVKRARVPYESLDWLLKKLEQQGMSMEKMESLQQSALKDMADMVGRGAEQQGGGSTDMGPSQPVQGPDSLGV